MASVINMGEGGPKTPGSDAGELRKRRFEGVKRRVAAAPGRMCLLLSLVTLLCVLAWTGFGLRKLRTPTEAPRTHMLEYYGPNFGQALGKLPIEAVHELGLHHRGAMTFVIRPPPTGEAALEILLLKRSDRMRDCAGAWSILGEHSAVGEPYFRTALRGLREELGIFAQETQIIAVQQCMVDQRLDRGGRKETPIDRQLTYLTAYRMDQRQHIDLDSEEAVSSVFLDGGCSTLSSEKSRDMLMITPSHTLNC